MRAVIADDEELVRFSVRDMLSEVPVPVTVLGEVEDGDALVDLCLELQPDLAIVDVRMPKMNGLEAIEALHARCPNTEWVILTSYSEFEYARRALNVGAVEYLLKPVGPEELAEAVKRVAERRDHRIRTENDWFENRITGLLSGIEQAGGGQELPGWKLAACLILAEDTVDQSAKRTVGARVIERLEDFSGLNTRVALSTLGEGMMVSVLGWRADALRRGTEQSFNERFTGRLAALVHELRNEGTTITAIHSSAPFDFSELTSVVDSLQAHAPFRLLSGFGSSEDVSRLDRAAGLENARGLASRLVAAKIAWGEGKPLPLEQALKEAALIFEQSPALRTPEIERNIERFLSGWMKRGAGPLTRVAEWLPGVREELAGARQGSHAGGSDAIEQALGFLEENFSKNISIAGVAVSLGLTPNYLSSLFHKRVGMTFSKYLTQLRMERAREILEDSGGPVGEVASRVGYSSARHFARTFKNTFGRYPSEIKRIENEA